VKLAGLDSSAVPGQVEPCFSGEAGQCQNSSGRGRGRRRRADLNAEAGTRLPLSTAYGFLEAARGLKDQPDDG
jgi:hypothetical protein